MTIILLNPTFSFPNLIDYSVASRIEGRKLIMHNNGLRPFVFHLAHYLMLFTLTFSSFLLSWIVSLAAGVKWSTVNPILPVLAFLAVAFEMSILVFAFSMLFKTRESFRNNFPNYMMAIFYIPSFISTLRAPLCLHISTLSSVSSPQHCLRSSLLPWSTTVSILEDSLVSPIWLKQ